MEDKNDGLQKSPLPSIALPKGGGAIQGSGEKFTANPSTGTGSMNIPIPTSPGRGGFGPSLNLSYDSGNANGLFGFGWQLSLPSITRKTSRGIPRYCDSEACDIFLISGADDLVPVLNPDGSLYEDDKTLPGYIINRYHPRTEGSYNRVERWRSHTAIEDVHWRVTSSDNVLSIYGGSEESRIFNPENKSQVFSWLLSETRDYKGNAILYQYLKDNAIGLDLSLMHQRNRGSADDPRRSANRYLKHIKYGNLQPLLDPNGNRPHFLSDDQRKNSKWLFEVVLDYGDNDQTNPLPSDQGKWTYRQDAFSAYRAGFEIRTTRLCRRFLMFHHFDAEENVGADCLVLSTELNYDFSTGPYALVTKVSRSGFKRNPKDNTKYIRLDQPSIEFEYSHAKIQDQVQTLEASSMENFSAGMAAPGTRWLDLFGEGLPSVMMETPGAWYLKRNLSPLTTPKTTPRAHLGPLECIRRAPNMNWSDSAQLLDLRGDGRLTNIVDFDRPIGLQRADGKDGWQAFHLFSSTMNRTTRGNGIRYLDLDGDGIADAMIADESLTVWYRSLEEGGFDAPVSIPLTVDDERGPRQLSTYPDELITVSDMSGDGLSDIVRIRNGEICYWPNLGYGRFGSKITMDDCPIFDHDMIFNPKGVLLADIDGTGTTDIIYMHGKGVRIYLNICGNSWSDPQYLSAFASPANVEDFATVDLLGNGTQCLVKSSPLPGTSSLVQYIDLMGDTKPFLLTTMRNNMGAATVITYACSTKFYLQDRRDGRPWISKLPFPVHVAEYVRTYDYIGKCFFSTRYAYHHGCFDLEEREFRGFGMVEQWDSEVMTTVTSGFTPDWANLSPEHQLPPVYTKSWFHTGIFIDGNYPTRLYSHEYYQDGAVVASNDSGGLLPDSKIPSGLYGTDLNQAFRSLKGCLLRQEIYSEDAPAGSSQDIIARSRIPHAITETNWIVVEVQPRGRNPFSVFQNLKSQSVTYTLERNVADPRIGHSMTLENDEFGYPLKSLSITYGRLQQDKDLPTDWDRSMQSKTIITYTESQMTNIINDTTTYRLPTFCETTTYELTGNLDSTTGLHAIENWQKDNFAKIRLASTIKFEDRPDFVTPQKRLLSCARTLFRKDDLTSLLPLGQIESLALGGESYNLAFTDSMINSCMNKNDQPLLSDIPSVLTRTSPGGGGYVMSNTLKASKLFPAADPDGQYWTPSGQSFFAPGEDANIELAAARQNYFTARRYRSPFGAENLVTFDNYQLFPIDAWDFIGNRITIGERNSRGDIIRKGIDYRVLHPFVMTDVNGNRTQLTFDALGRVVGNVEQGKLEENIGDSFDQFDPDLDDSTLVAHLNNPLQDAATILGTATTRYIYDPLAYSRSQTSDSPQPCVSYSMARTTHVSDLPQGQTSQIVHTFTYTDGFGKAIQMKTQTRAGPVPQRNAQGEILLDDENQPIPTNHDVSPRWNTSGWVIYNNKGQPVRQFEPFFSDLHTFEFNAKIGVSSVIFYDAPGRVVATLLPDGAYTKTTFDPWKSMLWDGNDTVLDDPRTDPDIEFYVKPYFDSLEPGFQTWYAARKDGDMGAEEKNAADKAAAHARTPKVTHFDSQGRTFLTVEHNKVSCPGHPLDGTDKFFYSRLELDISGKPAVIRDSLVTAQNSGGRVISTVKYDMHSNPMYKNGLENGESWMLTNINGAVIYAWNTYGVRTRSEFDQAGRHTRTLVLDGTGSTTSSQEIQVTRLIYGDNHWEATQRNLCGEVYATVDQAGIVANERINFKKAATEKTQRLCTEYRNMVDWLPLEQILPTNPKDPIKQDLLQSTFENLLMAETFTSTITYDALGRILTGVTPHTEITHANTARFQYDVLELASLDINLQGETSSNWTPFLKDVRTNAKGQRLLTKYGNDVTATNEYNFVNQLTARYTQRSTSTLKSDLQGLHFTYDTVNNVTNIRDDSQQTNYFRNEVTTPTNSYVYDSSYRLVQAIGREHVGQSGSAPTPYDYSDASKSGPQPGQAEAMAGYTEQYVYDDASNMTQMKHIGQNGGWTRNFFFQERSGILGEGDVSNKLSYSTVGNATEKYLYDNTGNAIRLPHLAGGDSTQNIHWNSLGQLVKLDLGGGGTAYYTYNVGGQRVRKVIERSTTQVEDRYYLGEIEVYRKKLSGNVVLERETMHVPDNSGRVAMVETRTKDVNNTDQAPAQLIRYQFTSHLGSSVLELDGQAQVLSFEEYSPYGSTTYQATNANLETPKRYRYTGKERDEESGLEYHAARYLAPWLGRWISADLGGAPGGYNLFGYAGANPIRLNDPSGRAGQDDDPPIYFGPSRPEKGLINSYRKDYNKITIQENDAPGAPFDKEGNLVSDEVRFGRATGAQNKVFMLKPQNQALGNSVVLDSPATQSFDPVSLKTNQELLFSRTFAELKELAAITQEAIDRVGGPGKMSPSDYNEAINNEIRQIIKYDPSENAQIVRDAFEFNRAELPVGAQMQLDVSMKPKTGRGGPPEEGGGGGGGGEKAPPTSSPEGQGTPAEAAPSPETTTTSASSEPMAGEGGGPVKTGGALGAVGKGANVVMGAAQVGHALHQFESGDTKGGALTLGILGTTTAIGTKVPGANLVLIPAGILATPLMQPSVLDRANDVYEEMLFAHHSEAAALTVWTVVALSDTAKTMVWDNTVNGLKEGWNAIKPDFSQMGKLQGPLMFPYAMPAP